MVRILNDEAAYSMVKWLNGGNTQAIKRRQLNAENADRSWNMPVPGAQRCSSYFLSGSKQFRLTVLLQEYNLKSVEVL